MYFPYYLPPLFSSPHQPLTSRVPVSNYLPVPSFWLLHIHVPPRTNLEYITPLNTKHMSTGTGMSLAEARPMRRDSRHIRVHIGMEAEP